MTTYPFVQAYHDLGPRKGPVLGLVIHMAEGGGTVGFLSRQNRNGVSVHYVIDYDGKITRMLLESHMHSSIRIGDNGSALRTTTEDGFGADYARAVLGKWAYVDSTLGPNHATIAVEIEGFAGKLTDAQRRAHPKADPLGGPSSRQEAALLVLVKDVRSRYPDIGLTGHRDHNIKACPGRRIPWDLIGGHGARAEEADVVIILDRTEQSGQFAIPARATVKGYSPKTLQVVKTWDPHTSVSSASFRAILRRVDGQSPTPLLEVSSGFFEGLLVPTSQVVEAHDPPPPTDVETAVAEAVAATKASARVVFE